MTSPALTELRTAEAPAAAPVGTSADLGEAALRAHARTLAAVLPARSLEIEQARTLPPDLVGQLRAAGLLQMALPTALGGPGIPPRAMVEIVEEISRADGATGWCVLVANIGAAFLAWLEPDAARQIVTGESDVVVAGGLAPLGQAVREGDQYRLNGRWPFGSGCLHANWFIGGFIEMADGRPKTNQWGMPEIRLAHFPATAGRVDDTWRVAGLAGTGSHDVVAEDVPVPVSLTSMPYFGQANHPDPLWRLSAYNLLLTLMAGFPLGVARRALDEARAQLAARNRPDSQAGGLLDPAVQLGLMRHETALAAARRHVLDTLDASLAAAASGGGAGTGEGPVDFARRAALAAAVIHGYDVGREAALECFRFGGTGALFDDNPLQRCMRDLVAGSQHVAFSADSRKRVANAMLGQQSRPVFFGV